MVQITINTMSDNKVYYKMNFEIYFSAKLDFFVFTFLFPGGKKIWNV